MAKLYLEAPIYKIGDIYYSPTSAVIDNLGELSRLRAREANLLHELIKSFPEVLSRSSIEQTLWKDSYATDATINQTVKALRFTLQDIERALIRTIPKQGYSLAIAPVLEENYGTKPSPEPIKINMSTPSADSVAKKRAPISRRYVVTSVVIALSSFLLAANGFFADEPDRISQQYGKHWILFNATEQELASLPIQDADTTKYVQKGKSFYRICSESLGGLECKKIQF
ncbi:winged helix-turn-helix domain-containing protein [Vibrio vulnificus]|uniref:winged helix-turn-helix domain-containing protein n=1 Tax=Vibrio vulnificus TaxID=672 RepID=UPI0021D9B48F|nr:winged helix-turn-helix domain-containing protein [Vibrio vulnificus]ELE2041899.1 winged helix-turn-helix domain-containing protein [Vibrio vulnificus]MCU8155773.1 winged helix-turn-helix domain-containing protein [Vibrio vulnificus]MDS1830384.1 winged helix-turn-helix domain-containing protein [Vibrio vulnificus]